MSENDRLIKVRAKLKRKRPKFIRQESWRFKRIKSSWRRPKGIDNKARRKKKGTIVSPNIGYRTPRRVRNLHPSGFKEVLVHDMTELEQVNPRKEVIKIAHGVGRQKRVMLQDRADELNVLILNRTRILLPGEELLLEEGKGFPEKEIESIEEIGAPEEETLTEEIEPSDEEETLEDIETSKDEESLKKMKRK